MIALTRRLLIQGAVALAIISPAAPAAAQSDTGTTEEVIRVWPGPAPGSEAWTGPEVSSDGKVPAGKIQIKTNVSVPTLTVVRPAPDKANGTAMLVLPGGAFMALAWDLEGTEVARWLAERGITAFILKYRVRSIAPPPGQKPPTEVAELVKLLEPNRKFAVADATQAMRVVRQNAAQYGVRPDRIGMIGFSAGAITTMGVLLEGDPRARPDFAAPIYGMTMIASPAVPADAPPLFIVTAQDDSTLAPAGSIEIFKLWTEAKRPAELHIYEKGGHGFGMRPSNLPVSNWPSAFEAWLTSHGLLAKPEAGPGAAAPSPR